MKDSKPSNRDSKPVNPRSVKGVVIPLHPTFDKLVALWILLKILRKKFGEIEVVSYSTTNPGDPKLCQLRKEGYYFIDVGENKYQKRRTGSAVETVCRDFDVKNPYLQSLVAICNRNNASGYLKSYSSVLTGKGEDMTFSVNGQKPLTVKAGTLNWSIVWLLREAYKVGWDVNDVIRHVHAVLDAWYAIQCGQVNESRWQKRLRQGKIRGLWNYFGSPQGSNLPLFSVPWLIWSLAVQGEEKLSVSVDQVADEVAWWSKLQRQIVELRAKAHSWALQQTSLTAIKRLEKAGFIFQLNAKSDPPLICGYFTATEIQVRELFPLSFGKSTVVDPADRLIESIFGPEKAGRKLDLLVVQNPKTNRFAILAGSVPLDFSELFARFRGLDRSLRKETREKYTHVWHLNEKGENGNKRHELLNGSDNWPLPATKIDWSTILRFVRESAKPFSKSS